VDHCNQEADIEDRNYRRVRSEHSPVIFEPFADYPVLVDDGGGTDTGGGGRLLAVDPRTGEQAWEVAGLQSCDAFVKLEGTGYLKTTDGTIHAFALSDWGRL